MTYYQVCSKLILNRPLIPLLACRPVTLYKVFSQTFPFSFVAHRTKVLFFRALFVHKLSTEIFALYFQKEKPPTLRNMSEYDHMF